MQSESDFDTASIAGDASGSPAEASPSAVKMQASHTDSLAMLYRLMNAACYQALSDMPCRAAFGHASTYVTCVS